MQEIQQKASTKMHADWSIEISFHLGKVFLQGSHPFQGPQPSSLFKNSVAKGLKHIDRKCPKISKI